MTKTTTTTTHTDRAARSRARLFGALLAATIAAPACHDETPKTFGPKGSPTTAEVASTVCHKAYDCCLAAQLMGNDMAGTTEAECEAKTASAYDDVLASYSTSEAQGRATYEPQLLMACLTSIRTLTCEQLGTTNHISGVPACADFATPHVAAGGACAHDWECAGGWCEHPADSQATNSGDGACHAYVVGGADCTSDRCAPGMACAGTPKVCLVPLAAGAACSATSAPCAGPACANGMCPAREGGMCFYSSGCQVGSSSGSMGTAGALVAVLLLGATRRRAAAGSHVRPR